MSIIEFRFLDSTMLC